MFLKVNIGAHSMRMLLHNRKMAVNVEAPVLTNKMSYKLAVRYIVELVVGSIGNKGTKGR